MALSMSEKSQLRLLYQLTLKQRNIVPCEAQKRPELVIEKFLYFYPKSEAECCGWHLTSSALDSGLQITYLSMKEKVV